ncbi:hypothetical protein PLICRDRAFT_177723 [Plicaturopsis crispa FD-325 SS-3]|nr:hypothetical protein PLICRDRAFT_177723 [Plicaturopsis crispa FD-325 SS-3]
MSGGLYEEETQTSSRRNLSWIWLIQGVPGQGDDITTDPIMSDALRIEWCCARARAMRWSEEIILLQEEMRRVKVTMEWQAVRWDSRAAAAAERLAGDGGAEGLTAYAYRQAALQRALKERCEYDWRHVSTWVSTGSSAVGDDPEDPLTDEGE